MALGIDYTVFLVLRAREEAAEHDTVDAVVMAVGLTGGVITSAGIVLASASCSTRSWSAPWSYRPSSRWSATGSGGRRRSRAGAPGRPRTRSATRGEHARGLATGGGVEHPGA